MVPLVLAMAGAALALATDVPALPALRCPLNATRHQCEKLSSTEFTVNDFHDVEFTYEVNKTLTLKCDNKTLTHPDTAKTLRWLPQFTPALHVGNVTVVNCRPVHYATVLAALNVTLTPPFNFEVTTIPWKIHLETPVDLTDLPLRHLRLNSPGVLHDLPASLETLTLEDMDLPDNVLEAPPRTLTELRLERVNITRVPAAVLDLPELRSLYVDFEVSSYRWYDEIIGGTVERGNASRLQQLYVNGADAALMSDWAPPALEEVTLRFWRARSPNQIPACDKLVNLTLLYSRISKLPDGWVARCSRLKVLHIQSTKLYKLPPRLLENATQITSLRITDTFLSSLPAQLFAYTPHLTHLDLNGNELWQLPSSMLTLPLLELDLGNNFLNTSVTAEVAASFPELRSLSLAGNWKGVDLCSVNDSNVTEYKMKSSLASLSKLERLELQGTDIWDICSDWREDMVNLKYLDLSSTNADNLTYQGMHYNRNVPAVVKFSGKIYFTADDYKRAAAAAAVAPPNRKVTIIVTELRFSWPSMPDDCHYYWITKAFNDGLLPLHDLEIYDKPPLRTVREDFLLCGRKETCADVC